MVSHGSRVLHVVVWRCLHIYSDTFITTTGWKYRQNVWQQVRKVGKSTVTVFWCLKKKILLSDSRSFPILRTYCYPFSLLFVKNPCKSRNKSTKILSSKVGFNTPLEHIPKTFTNRSKKGSPIAKQGKFAPGCGAIISTCVSFLVSWTSAKISQKNHSSEKKNRDLNELLIPFPPTR